MLFALGKIRIAGLLVMFLSNSILTSSMHQANTMNTILNTY